MLDKVALFNALYDVSAGTLWRAHEDLLKERMPTYDPNSTRYCHPVLSIRRAPLALSFERIPMLVGRSSAHGGPVHVRGVFRDSTAERVTHFGNCLAPLLLQDFTEPVGDPGHLTGDMLEALRVVVNRHKPRLNHLEQGHLEAWMQRKGL